MANPNIAALTTINGNTQVQSVTTAATAIADNPSSSGKILKINSLIISNIHASNAADITVDLYRNTTAYKLVSTISVGADTSFTAIDKTLSIYLMEGDSLRLTAGTNSVLQAVCSFEEIS
jgi:hypothetical protein